MQASLASAGERYIISTEGVNFSQTGRFLAQSKSARLKVVYALKNLQVFVVEAEDAQVASFLATLPGVKSISKDRKMPLPEFQMMSLETDQLTSDVGVTPWGVTAVKAPEAWTTTQGENVKVAVIDTGVDRDHPALRANFVAGKNFAPLDEKVDYDYFDVYGHGTHVAGTILGDGTQLYGVAPKAKLYSARVCAKTGCSYGDIYAGVDWGIENHVDVMNLSLGGGPGGEEEIAVFKRAREAGITVIAAAGNDGQATVSYPAALDTVVAVGALDSQMKRASFSNYGDGLEIMGPGVNVFSSVPQGKGAYSELKVSKNGVEMEVEHALMAGSVPESSQIMGDLIYVGLGKKADFDKADVKGKIALISRGEISFNEKAANALGAGAAGAIIFNNVDGMFNGTLNGNLKIAAFSVSKATGVSLMDGAWAASAMLYSKSNYANNSGTSMASPHVAGVAALVKGANPKLTPQEVINVLFATATNLGEARDFGAGLVDAEMAVKKANE